MKPAHVAIEVSQDEHYRSPFLKSIKENWPSLAKDYRHYCHVFKPRQGDVWVWTSPEGQKFIHFILDGDDGAQLTSDERFHFFKMGIKHLTKMQDMGDVEHVTLAKGSFKFNEKEMEIAQELLSEAFKRDGSPALV